jgi:hypothetical protein
MPANTWASVVAGTCTGAAGAAFDVASAESITAATAAAVSAAAAAIVVQPVSNSRVPHCVVCQVAVHPQAGTRKWQSNSK